MALLKNIELENGIVTNYHRIVSLNSIVNNQNIIEVASYINQNKRKEEKEYYDSNDEDKSMNVFIDTRYYNANYDENMSVKTAYNYLKSLDEFKDAEDV